MPDYPQKTCTIDRLVRQPKLVAAVLSGEKTQQRRDGVYGYPGEEFNLQGQAFVMTGLERKTLGEMTDDDARAEGFADMRTYRDLILRMHAGMQWNPEHQVWVHYFSKKNT